MKFFKSEKGFTLIDITVALIIVLLLMSVISILFFNLTKSSKAIERESQATYIATNIIEAYRAMDYDDEKLSVNYNGAMLATENGHKVATTTITDGMQLVEGQAISVPDGYLATARVENYRPEGETEDNDLVKKIKVTVKYKVANETKEVVLETSIVRK